MWNLWAAHLSLHDIAERMMHEHGLSLSAADVEEILSGRRPTAG
jgi:hypothetical protein